MDETFREDETHDMKEKIDSLNAKVVKARADRAVLVDLSEKLNQAVFDQVNETIGSFAN